MRTFAIAILAVMSAAFGQPPLSGGGPYRITHTYTLGGDGSWDYIVPDLPSHRIFIGRQDRVMVVDTTNGTLIGEVTGVNGAHGTAIASRSGRGFATPDAIKPSSCST